MNSRIDGLIGESLDARVAVLEGWAIDPDVPAQWHNRSLDQYALLSQLGYSSDWALGGTIIQRQRINLTCDDEGLWSAGMPSDCVI